MENHIYEVPYSQQCLTYTKQCREVINEAVSKNSIHEASFKQLFNSTNKQYQVGRHSYEAPYSLLFYNYTDKLCRMVDEQILLAYCSRNNSKQRQYVAKDPGVV